ncbi:MAG: hypothetical protein JXA73_04045 [Acidobacteria bacterium]|nr:hypothetical protein [Acidobacteriota bacterium]
MSELRINILDASRAINGTLHGFLADSIIAGLAAEPETIEELEDAMIRFTKPANKKGHLARFSSGVNEEPWDAGIIFVDLAARVFAAESSYSILLPEGEVQYHNGRELTEVWLPYRIPRDWLLLDSVAEYKAVVDQRRAERAAVQPLDSRSVLYVAILEFIATECRAARKSNKEDPVAEIHAKWLMTPRDDLRGLPPREILLMKREDIDYDMQWREMHWSRLKEPAPCLKKESHAYRFAGFGTHEIVIYYDLVRMLIENCWERMREGQEISIPGKIARLEQVKTEWLDSPDPEHGGKSPSCLIECERIRLPWLSSEDDFPYDDDCPLCQDLAKEKFGPGFWHLDGCNMDDDFAFSFCRTREEWEEERDELI